MSDDTMQEQPFVRRTESRVALGVFFTVLFGYVLTIAPTVTFWDAGEFLAASKILGVPHPPGTPVFVFLSNVWAKLIPFGAYAFRVNLMTAVFSAAAAAFMFLVVFHTTNAPDENGVRDSGFAYGAGIAGALVSAFAFTVWQNSNESEVYMVSGLCIAVSCWLAWLWRKYRGQARAPHLVLLIIYLGAFSIGNHLMTLLVGPAILGYMLHVIWTDPLADPDGRIEFAQWLILASVWALLISVGLGGWPPALGTATQTLSILAIVMLAGALIYAMSLGMGPWFTLAAVAVSFVGISTYLFIYIRAGLHPMINEADPSTWDNLLAVIRRDQYPPRSPTDNPMFQSGPGNPGRFNTPGLVWLQIQNYLQYFDWQWSNGLAPTKPLFHLGRLPFTLLFTSLGIVGAGALWEKDRSVFWLLILIFAITGPGLVGYMNFKPGFSIGFEQYADGSLREVRERDYFFTISFQMWGILAGIGIAWLFKMARDATGSARATMPVFGLALLPFALNFNAASRGHGPEPQLARDFAYDLLQSIEPYGILFTNGDNDTFPLWYLQEVEAVRQDVTVVNLSLGNTSWYIQQLRDNPVRSFEPDQAPFFAHLAPPAAPPALHTLTDEQIGQMVPQRLPSAVRFQAGLIDHVLPENQALFVKDMLILRLISENAALPEGQRRPIYISTTAGSGNWLGLQRYLVQEGLAIRLYMHETPDSTRLGAGVLGVPVDVPRTDSLAWNIYRYAGLFDVDSLDLDPTNANIATNLSLPFLTLYQAYLLRGNTERARENLQRAYDLSPSPRLVEELVRLATTPDVIPLGDTAASVPLDTATGNDQP